MRESLPVVAAAIGLSLLGSLALHTLLTEPAAQAGPAASRQMDPGQALPAADPSLEVRIQQLERQNHALRQRLDQVENRVAAPQRTAVDQFVSRSEFEAMRSRIEQAGVPLATADNPATFQEQVHTALEEIRHQETVDKFQTAAEKNAERLDQRVAGMTEWLELDSYQQQRVRQIFADKDQRDLDLIQAWRDGVDEEVLHQRKADNQQQYEAALAETLNGEQLQRLADRFGKRRSG